MIFRNFLGVFFSISVLTAAFIGNGLSSETMDNPDWENKPYCYSLANHKKPICNHMKIIGAHEAHKEERFGQNVKIAIIDDGWFDCNGDTKERLTQSTRDRLAHLQPLPGEEREHGFGHSNLVASIIAGTHGIAPQAQLEVFSVASKSCVTKESWDEWNKWCVQAIDKAIQSRVDFINMSIGWNFNFSPILKEALYRARDAKIGVFIAASNDGLTVGSSQYPEINDFLEQMHGYAWMVTATRYKTKDTHTFESKPKFANNFMNRVAVYGSSAPGKGILSFGAYLKERVWSGTSAATPIVTGCAALIKSAYPDLSITEVLNVLAQSARKTFLTPSVTLEDYIKSQHNALASRFNSNLDNQFLIVTKKGLFIDNDAEKYRGDTFSDTTAPNREEFLEFSKKEYKKENVHLQFPLKTQDDYIRDKHNILKDMFNENLDSTLHTVKKGSKINNDAKKYLGNAISDTLAPNRESFLEFAERVYQKNIIYVQPQFYGQGVVNIQNAFELIRKYS